MDEIIVSKDTDIGLQSNKDISVAQGKVLYIAPEMRNFDYKMILGQVLQCVNTADILSKIKQGTQYVVQIPAEFQKAYESGEYFLMQNAKTGKLWPSLMKITEDGRNQVVSPLPIAKQAISNGNPIQELSNNYHNMLLQQQMVQITELLEETFVTVKRIEHGQMDDRIGLLEAGKNGLLLALSMPEGQDRTMQINSSRQNLLVAQSQIGETLKRRAAEFKIVPKTALGQFLHEMQHSGYLAGKDQEIIEMQEYFDLYLQATKCLAASYAIFGDMKTAEETFLIGEKFMQQIDFKKVQSICYAHKKDLSNMFFMRPKEFISEEKTFCLKEAKQYDYVAIEVPGETLLEALNDGRTE